MDPTLQDILNRKRQAGVALRPCVFLDRDGTLTEEKGYVNHPDRLELLPGAAAAVARLNAAGVLAVVVTNQAGVARGYFTIEVLAETHERLVRLLAEGGARLDGLYFSPYHSSSHDPRWRDESLQMRKPGLGMIRQAVADLPIDLEQAYMVGDRHGDVVFARRAGVRAVFVKTGYGLGEFTYQRHAWTDQPDHVAADLPGAVDWILADLATAGWRPPAPEAAAAADPDAIMRAAAPADKIVTLDEAAAFARRCQAKGLKVVFANGCFDIIHGGHVSYLNEARAEGDVVIVGINSDASERILKGPDRPVMPEDERAELIAGMEAVDRVVIFEELTAECCLRAIRPDVHAKGTDYTAQTVPERAIADELGIRVAITGAPKTNASKQIMRAIRDKGLAR